MIKATFFIDRILNLKITKGILLQQSKFRPASIVQSLFQLGLTLTLLKTWSQREKFHLISNPWQNMYRRILTKWLHWKEWPSSCNLTEESSFWPKILCSLFTTLMIEYLRLDSLNSFAKTWVLSKHNKFEA